MTSGCFGAVGSYLGWQVIAGCIGMTKMAGVRRQLLVLFTNSQWQVVFVEVNVAIVKTLT